MTRITLDTEQLAAVERMVNEPTRAALNASQFGTGKTVVTVEVAQRIAPTGIKMIVAPLNTKYSWEATIKNQYPDELVFHINSKKEGKLALETMLNGFPGWYIIGREYFASAAVRDRIAKFSPSIDFLAYDECQKWANYKSAGFRNMKRIKPGYKMALSATPAANKFTGLFAITQWLWPKLEGHASYWRFVGQWCETTEDHFAGTVPVGEKEPKGSFVLTLPCYVRLTKDFGEPIEDKIIVRLSAKERRIYDEIEKTMITWLEDNPLVISLPITKRLRLRQASLGELAYDKDADLVYFAEDMKSSKYDALVEFMKEHDDEPMLIFTHSAKYAHTVAWQLIRDGYKALPYTGEVPETERHALKQAFQDGEIDYIVATPDSIGEGVDGLQHRAHIMAWLSRSDNGMLNEQAFRRLYRRGQTKTVISMDFVAENTYDEGQLSTLVKRALDMNRSLKYEDK